MFDLDTMLKRAAQSDDWANVVHRCAWCRRTADADGQYRTIRIVDAATVVTDGMCPTCGAGALAHISARKRLASAA
jgi:hypothetical protein